MKKILVVLSFFFLILLSSCSNKYGAKIYSKINDNIKENIFDEYKVENADYSDEEDNYYSVDDAPKYWLFTIDNKEDYDIYFKDEITNINYDKERIYLYIFCNTSLREYYIESIYKKDDKLRINIRMKRNNRKDAVQPYARAIAVKIKKMDVKNVGFNVN